MYKALFPFTPSADSELELKEGQLYELETPDNGGWMLVKNNAGQQGWVPTSYLKEEPVAARAPPPAPAKRAPPAPPKANGSGKASPALKAKPAASASNGELSTISCFSKSLV